MRRVVILTNGSRGDVQPYVALGRALQQSGDEVLLAADERFRPLAAEQGVPFAAIGGDVRALLESDVALQLRDSGQQLRWMLYAIRESGAYLARGYGDAWELCRSYRPDLIIFTIATPIGYSIAERLGVPSCYAGLQPIHPTRAFPSVWFGLSSLGPALNQTSHRLFDQLFWQTHRSHLNQFRRQQLNLPPLGFFGPARRQAAEQLPILYGFSPLLVPPPADWPRATRVTGYWFLDAAASWTPPRELVDFLDAGAPPIAIGFGSMHNPQAGEITRLVLTALQQVGRRGILMTGWGGLAQVDDLPPDVLVIPEAPHSYLLPQVAAVVHHGGAGTTAAALRAGVPSVVVPHIADHFFWGRQVAKLGASPTPLPQSRLTGDSLAAALHTAVNNASIRQRAAAIGATIRAENGLGEAVRAVGALL